MSRVREVTPRVFDLLKKHPETRNDDRILFYRFYETYYNLGTAPLYRVLELQRLDRVPNFESVRRARQKIQAYCEDLRAEEPFESIRIAEQEDYIEYAREELTV